MRALFELVPNERDVEALFRIIKKQSEY
jgi:hypothetical protein